MASAKNEAPSLMALLDQYVDRRAALTKRRFELEEQLPKLRQAWNEAAATADPSDDLPAQRAFEQAEREFKNVEAALMGIEQKIVSTRHDIANAQRRAAVAAAKREAKAMQAEAKQMEDSLKTFLGHAAKFAASHNLVRQLIGAGDQLVGFAYWVERQLIGAGLPDLAIALRGTSVRGEGTSASEAAKAMADVADSAN